jgi:hypothetical protein
VHLIHPTDSTKATLILIAALLPILVLALIARLYGF